MPKTIQFPITQTAGDIQVDWGDGNVETFTQAAIEALVAGGLVPSHEYLDGEATYTIRVTGPVIAFDHIIDAPFSDPVLGEDVPTHLTSEILCPIVSLDHFGTDSVLQRLTLACAAPFLQSVPDRLPASVTHLESTFRACSQLNQAPLLEWDTSNVLSMSGMFAEVDVVSPAINSWNVSSVTTMTGMFASVGDFQADIGIWNVSSVRYMGFMFSNTKRSVFDLPFQFTSSPIVWDTSSVVDMTFMFFDCPIEVSTLPFNTANVKNFSSMFATAHRFNADISGWDTGSAVSMDSMFRMHEPDGHPWNPGDPWVTPAFNQDLSGWNVSNVTDMDFMFYRVPPLAHDLTGWCVTNIPSRPTNFTLDVGPNEPVWGTCPGTPA